MKKITVSKLNIILAAGIISIMVGIFLMVWYASTISNGFPFISVSMILAGSLVVYCALAFTKKTSMLYAGLLLVSVGILNLLISTGITSLSIKQLWPVIVVLSGVCLFISGIYRHHRIRASYFFPAILLVILGVIFLMFSLSIIKFSFIKFVVIWWPILLIVFGLVLVGVFLYQQHCENQFPYVQDDTSDGDNAE